eukprot:1106824-Pyramimonas_sp.AAC.1
MWTDDGMHIGAQYRAVRAGFGCCLQCPTLVRYRTNVIANYLQPPGETGMVAARTRLGLAPRFDAPPRGENRSEMISNRLRAMSRSSADALDNLSQAEQRQRKWVNQEHIRSTTALAGGAFMNSQPGAVPSWRPDSISAQPLACHEPYLQCLEP